MDIYRQGQERYPVVYVSYEDMKAYAKWAGKRLPTQAEWQLAAQGTDKRKWPWGNEFHGTLCNNAFGKATPVDAFSKGRALIGVMDLVGNVWQMTNDMYFNGSYYFTVIRGGSYYQARLKLVVHSGRTSASRQNPDNAYGFSRDLTGMQLSDSDVLRILTECFKVKVKSKKYCKENEEKNPFLGGGGVG